jgi:chemotaxis protein MotB
MAEEHQQHEEEGEGWLVSYADLVTLLFGLFVMLYAMADIDDKKFSEIGKSMAAGFKEKAPDITSDETQPSDVLTEETRQMRAFQMLAAIMNLGDPNSAVRKVAKAYEASLDGASIEKIAKSLTGKSTGLAMVESKIDQANHSRDDSVTEIMIPVDDIFYSKSATLTPGAKITLTSLYDLLIKVQDFVSIRVEVHCDSDVSNGHGEENKWELTTNQAMAIVRFLVEAGLPGNIISAIGKANYNPLLDEVDAKGNPLVNNKIKNRRVNIILEKKLK